MRRKLRPQRARAEGTEDEPGTRIYYWWLLLALVFEYVRPTVFFPSMAILKPNSLVPFTLLLVVLFAPGLRPFSVIFSDRFARWLVAFILLILLSVPFAEVTSSASDVFMEVLSHFILFLIIARVVFTEQRLCGVFMVLILSHLVLIVLNPALVLEPEKRSYINGSPYLGDGNDFALSICILLPMAIELALRARSRFGQIIAWLTFVALLLAVLSTQSRGASIALCAIAGFLWLTSERKGSMSLGIGAIVVIAALFASDAYFSRMASLTNYQMDSSAGARLTAWKSAVWMARDNPVFGIGAGQFPMAYATKYLPEDADSDKMMTAHSMYFLVLGELGMTGIVTLTALVFGGIRATMAMRRRVLEVHDRSALRSKAEDFSDAKSSGGQWDWLCCRGRISLGCVLCAHFYVVGDTVVCSWQSPCQHWMLKIRG